MTEKFEDLLSVVERLRDPNGCPWDRAQTHASLRQYLLEECYEAIEAIDSRDSGALAEELGDLLVHIAFHADIARRTSEWTADRLIARTADKLIRRHPHVFGDAPRMGTAAEVVGQWEALKRAERGTKGIASSVPRSLPALAHAAALQRKAEAAGVEWRRDETTMESDAGAKKPGIGEDRLGTAEDGIEQRLRALRQTPEGDGERRETLAGDLLFEIVAELRSAGVDPETALRSTSHRFRQRLTATEEAAGDTPLVDLPASDRARLWEETGEP